MGLAVPLVDAYLDRLGLEHEPPSVEALAELHRRHVERIPYETLWIHAGEPWGIDPVEAAERVARHGRGGYCFHLNGAFSELLDSLGYAVTRHVGGVHGPAGPDADGLTNHLVLTVAGLPAEANPTGTWYVDAGLGDALHEPLPLAPGRYRQGPFDLILEETPGDVGDWHLTHDPAGSFAGMSWLAAPAEMGGFVDRHEWLSTAPESGFVRVATVQRRDGAGVDILRGLLLSRLGEGGGAEAPVALTERDDWFAALADVFALRFDGAEPALLDRLWSRCLAKHEAWVEAGSP